MRKLSKMQCKRSIYSGDEKKKANGIGKMMLNELSNESKREREGGTRTHSAISHAHLLANRVMRTTMWWSAWTCSSSIKSNIQCQIGFKFKYSEYIRVQRRWKKSTWQHLKRNKCPFILIVFDSMRILHVYTSHIRIQCHCSLCCCWCCLFARSLECTHTHSRLSLYLPSISALSATMMQANSTGNKIHFSICIFRLFFSCAIVCAPTL